MSRYLDAVNWQGAAAATLAVAAIAVSARYWQNRHHHRGNSSGSWELKPLSQSASPATIVQILVKGVELGRITTYAHCVYVARGSNTKLIRLTDEVATLAASHVARLADDHPTKELWRTILAAHEASVALETRRKTSFDDSEPSHVAVLKDLWTQCFPHLPFERRGEQWSLVGFQGLDPTTDLRGGGMAALDHICSFARLHRKTLQVMMDFNQSQQADGEDSWYLTAVVSIQFTVQLLSQRDHPIPLSLLEEIHGSADGVARVHHKLMLHFKDQWHKDLPHVMEYNQYMPKVYRSFFHQPS